MGTAVTESNVFFVQSPELSNVLSLSDLKARSRSEHSDAGMRVLLSGIVYLLPSQSPLLFTQRVKCDMNGELDFDL